ncbi:Cytochrome P450 82C4 [Cocos nucifera]|uniref:Cytochrome P450 82C4 n=1 Tax=Cocos nucifera TaxID=13894 RepID=A0A8K0IFA2_COCNU|nr:Cytochrome P450 82C4 [Cocos nucifera]
MADKYGPVFMLHLGARRTLVVNSWESAKECLATNDKVFATRPGNAAGKHLGYNYAMVGFAPYGSYWRSVRKIIMVELLSNARLETLKHFRSMEMDTCIRELYELWLRNDRRPVKVEMKQWLGGLAYNIVVRVVAGKRYFGSGTGSDEAWRFRKAINRIFGLLDAFVASDVFPCLKWMDCWGHETAMKNTAREVDSIMAGLLEEHRRRRLSGKATGGAQDFMDVMLSIVEDAEFSEMDVDTVIKATSLALVMGGTDTTTTSLAWTLALLVKNPQGLKKAQDEIDGVVGKDRHVEESDVKNLVYLQAIVKEVFRLYPPAELLVEHEATADCRIGGYNIAAGTRLRVNVWKLQRDPLVWSEPNEFRPERFLSAPHAGVDVRGQHFELIPFGSGRRSCPGISFALQVMHLTLARLIQGFELETPGGGPLEMADDLGLPYPNTTPLEVLLRPRLADMLYE